MKEPTTPESNSPERTIASVADGIEGNHRKPRNTPFARRKELEALVSWLEQEQSDAVGWRILDQLARRSLERIDMTEEARSFTTEDLCEWADVEPASNVWKSVNTWWESRRRRIRLAMESAGAEFEPILDRRGGGGRGNKAVNSLRIDSLGDVHADDSQEEDGADTPKELGKASTVVEGLRIHYRLETDSPVLLSNRLLRWLFSDGSMSIGSLRHNVLRFNLLGSSLFLVIFLVSALVLLVIENRPVSSRDVGVLILVFLGCLTWWQKWRPVLHAREDRITALPEEWLPLKEKPAQLERKRTDSCEVLRLVRYVATCPICGGDVQLASGAPEWKRRTIGRCVDAPREHVFSFDPVMLTGRRL